MSQVRALFFASLAALLSCVAVAPVPGTPRWWRGNTHTHTLWSDGDAAPELAVDLYKSRGYHFLALTDHNSVLQGEKWKALGAGKGEMNPETLPPLQQRFASAVQVRERDGRREMRLRTFDELRKDFDEAGRFLLLPGEEITDQVAKAPVHHNLLNLASLVPPPGGASVREALERTTLAADEAAHRAGRPLLLHLNHPNFHYAVSSEDLGHALAARFFEVYNGHRSVNNLGDAIHPSTERLWDLALGARLSRPGGSLLYGVATDDTHHYHKADAVAAPFRGWIMVKAPSLDAAALIEAMHAGAFYASSGVGLEDVAADRTGLSIRITAEPGVTYTTRFIGMRRGGAPGETLAESTDPAPAYRFRGDEIYVRATIRSSRPHPSPAEKGDVESAWVQPVRP